MFFVMFLTYCRPKIHRKPLFFNNKKQIRLKLTYKYATKINHCLKKSTVMTGHNYTVSGLVDLSSIPINLCASCISHINILRNNTRNICTFKARCKGLMHQIISVLGFYSLVPNIFSFTLVFSPVLKWNYKFLS